MKPFTVEIDIDLPRDEVIALFDDPDNLAKWQNGFQSFEPISGVPGEPGAKSRLVYQHGRQRMELTETVTKRDLPDEFNGRYEWDGGHNTLENRFIELAPDRTRWVSVCAYEFTHPMLKVMGFFAPGMFRRQNLKFMRNFKSFCEDGRDIRDTDHPKRG
ncbi:MAG: SRPBCC family protein [Phycisphaerales bacterium]